MTKPRTKPMRFRGTIEDNEAKEAYLEALGEFSGDIKTALSACSKSHQWLSRNRRIDPTFAEAERVASEMETIKWTQECYLDALSANYGNKTKARHEAGVTQKHVDEWCKDEDFAKREQEIYEAFVDLANEQNVRLMVGAKTSVKNPEHLRWALPKVDKRWEDKPKVTEIRYGGSVTVKDTRDAIKELLRPEDVVDAEIIEG